MLGYQVSSGYGQGISGYHSSRGCGLHRTGDAAMTGREFGPAAALATGRDRTEAVIRLKAHKLAGRLTEAEVADRSTLAAEARSLGQLDHLFDDLPVLLGPGVTSGVTGRTLTGREALLTLRAKDWTG